ncbi:hypothetical protein TNCV_1667701 [Trichonephila clavipes]|nr:hypothetical protein TNCV_1667701 [Trichonephila clavipes]
MPLIHLGVEAREKVNLQLLHNLGLQGEKKDTATSPEMISTGALPGNVAPAWGSSGKGQRVGGIAGAAHHRSRNSFLGTLIIGRQGRSKPLYKCRRNPRAMHETR